jgi:rhomboid protease GluP
MNYPEQDPIQGPIREDESQVSPPRPPAPRAFYGGSFPGTPTVTYAIMGITIFVYVVQYLTQNLLGADLPAAYGLKANQLIVRGQLWRLITPVLLHGSILHIGFNMYALYLFGPGLERYFGRWRFTVLYLLSGFAGNVASFIFTPAPSLGSSTAIFGLLGAEAVFLYQNRELFGRRSQQALINILIVAGINLVIGLSPGIDNWGHIGGLAGGTLFAWFAGPIFSVQGSYPLSSFVDRRDTRDFILTSLGVGAIFAFLAALTIYLRGGGGWL